jgi:Protein of unknown function (DUF998)
MGVTRSVWLGRLAVAGPIAFTIAWLVGGLVQDQYIARQEDISALAAMDARQPWIMITGFVLLGVGTVALAAGLASTLRSPSAVVGSALLMIAGIGLAVAGLARNDCSSELPDCAARVDAGDVSWHHQVHDNVSLILFLALIAAPLVFARAFGRDQGCERRKSRAAARRRSEQMGSSPASDDNGGRIQKRDARTAHNDRWRPLRTYSIVTGVLGFALLVLYVVVSVDAWDGLVQRTFVSVLFLWIAVVGFRLSRIEHVEAGAR